MKKGGHTMSFIDQRLSQMDALANWPSQAPVFAQINEHIPEMCKLPYDYLFRDDPVSMAECTLLLWEYYDLTNVLANLDVYNYEAESMGQAVNFYKGHIPDVDRGNFLIKDEKDIDKIRFNGFESGRFPYHAAYLEAIKQYTGQYLIPNLCAPWSLACNIYGMENLLVDCLSESDFVHAMFCKLVDDFYAPMFRGFIEKYPENLSYQLADAWASPPMVTNEIYLEFIVPYIERIVEKIDIKGFSVSNIGVWGIGGFNDENERKVFADMLIKTSGMLSSLDPDNERIGAKWAVDYGSQKNCPVLLGIGTSFLETASIDTIISRCKDYSAIAMSGNTPVIMLLNNISPFTPPDKVHAAIAAIRFYARPDTNIDQDFKIPKRESFEEFIKEKVKNNLEGYKFTWLGKSGLMV